MTDRVDHDDRSTPSFVRGLTVGAILGAIIAGSSLWTRRQRANRNAAAAGLARTGPSRSAEPADADSLEPASVEPSEPDRADLPEPGSAGGD